jgi:hypothetical protein
VQTRGSLSKNLCEQEKLLFFRRDGKTTPTMSNTHPTAEEEYASLAFDSDDDEDASSGDEEEEMVGETQPAQQKQQPILTSLITDGRRYQLRSTPDRLASSQRGLQQQP